MNSCRQAAASLGRQYEFMDRDLAPLDYNEMHNIRGNEIAMISRTR